MQFRRLFGWEFRKHSTIRPLSLSLQTSVIPSWADAGRPHSSLALLGSGFLSWKIGCQRVDNHPMRWTLRYSAVVFDFPLSLL